MLLVEQRDKLGPGESAEVRVEVPTRGLEGQVTKTFFVDTDAPEPEWQQLKLVLHLYVELLLKAVPEHLQFGTVAAGDNPCRTVQVRSSRVDLPARLRAVASDHPEVHVRVADRKPGLITAEVSLGKSLQPGNFTATLTFTFDGPDLEPLRVLATGRCAAIKSPVVTPARLTLNDPEPGRPAFRIVAAQAPPGLDVSWQASDSSPACYQVTVTWGMDLPLLAGSATVTLETDPPFPGGIKVPVAEGRARQATEGRSVP